MRLSILTICLLIMICSSCNESKKTEEEDYKTINLDINKCKNEFLSSIFDSLTYLVLEDKNTASLLKSITKIEINDSSLFIFDREMNKICEFNKSGKYQKNIGIKGQGPGEFIKISDFTIDKNKKEVLILDRSGRKVLFYNLDGKFLRQEKITIMANQLAILDKHIFLYTGGSDFYTDKKSKLGYNLFIADKKCHIIDKKFIYNQTQDNIQVDKVFDMDKSNSTLLFHYSIYDTIYKYDKNNSLTKIVLNFNENKIPIKKINKDNFKFYLNKSGFARILQATHSDKYLFVSYTLNNRVNNLIYNTYDKSTHNISFFENDIDKTSFALTLPLTIQNNKAFFVKNPDILIECYKQDTVTIKQNEISNRITIDSNPIIVIGHLK